MKWFKRLKFLWILFLLAACKSGPPTEIDLLKDKVMAVHDEVMPEIKYMQKLVKELKNEKLESGNDTTKINQLIFDISEADSLMFDWMRNYRIPKTLTEEDKLKAYLNDQLAKIEIVSTKMKSSINAAELKLNK